MLIEQLEMFHAGLVLLRVADRMINTQEPAYVCLYDLISLNVKMYEMNIRFLHIITCRSELIR